MVLAFVLYALGLAKMIDQFIYREMYSYLAHDPAALQQRYVDRFPGFLQPLFGGKPEPATIICVVLFTVSGLLLWAEEEMWPKVVALTAFILAFWNLFSTM